MINVYYFSMSVYGWYVWTRKVDEEHVTPIARATAKEHLWSVIIFVATVLFVFGVYTYFEKWTSWTAYVDTFDDLSSVDVGLTVNGSTGNTTPNTDRSGYKVYKFTAGTGNIKF